jgi:hypothetical protein
LKKFFTLLIIGLLGALANTVMAAENKQNSKMTECQAQATEKKLESKDRQAFVNTCLKAKPVKAPSKMAECNAKTKGMTKEEADKTRSTCMKG